MVFTYSGIAKVLWGSLPTERLCVEDKRTINSSQHTLSGQSDESPINGPINSSSSLMNPTLSANLIIQENRQKAAKMLIAVVIIFAICYIPVHVFNLFRYVYVYLDYIQRSRIDNNYNSTEIIQCFEPKVVSLERTGTIKVVTISALISHFLPYFNSSINPIIYNIMSDKFRLKFRELFSSCCCCCKSLGRRKSPSTTMIPFKTQSTVQQTSQQASPNLPTNTNRYKIKKKNNNQITNNSLNVSTKPGQALSNNISNNNMTRHTGINPYTNNESITFRLTNV